MPARKFTDEQIDTMCDMRERGKSFRQIANHLATGGLEISESAVSWHCLVRGADAPPDQRQVCKIAPGTVMKRGNHVVRMFTDAEDQHLLTLEGQGHTMSEIARRLNRKPNSIRGRLATLARREEREAA